MLQESFTGSVLGRYLMSLTMISQIRRRTWNRLLLPLLSLIDVPQSKWSYHPQPLYKDKSPMTEQGASFARGSPSKCTPMRWRVRCTGERYRVEGLSRCVGNAHDRLIVNVDSQMTSRKNKNSIRMKAPQAVPPRSRYLSRHLYCRGQEKTPRIALLLISPGAFLLHSSVILM